MRWHHLLLKAKPLVELATSVAGFLAAVLLGVMAILLSHAANRIAKAELQLAERQTLVAEHQLEPRFRFEEEVISEEQTSLLRLYNDGAPIEWFNLEQITFLGLESYGQGPRETRLVPTYYYGDRQYTGAVTDLLATLSSSWLLITGEPATADEHFRQLGVELHAWRQNLTLILRPFIVIHYVDSLGRHRAATYEIRPLHGAFFGPSIPRRLPDDKATRVRGLFGPIAPAPLYMLSAEDLREGWNSYPLAEALDVPIRAGGV